MIAKILNTILIIILCFILFTIGLICGHGIHKMQYDKYHYKEPQKVINNEIQVDGIN